MTELARGSIGDRPWGMTLGALGMRGLTGQLDLAVDGKRYIIAFVDGAVVGSYSPLASDAAVRIAMTGGLLSSTMVADIARRQQANPHRDEVDVISEAVRLAPDQVSKLRRRTVAQRAARTFSLERGDFIVDDQITLPVVAGSELDVRSVIFLGARNNMSETRLAAELALFGTWFRLLPDALVDLPQYGFGRDEDPVLDILEPGGSIADLERMGEPHVVRAMIYALASCSAVEAGQAADARNRPPPQPTRPPPQRTQPIPSPVQSTGSQRHAAPQPIEPSGSQRTAVPHPVEPAASQRYPAPQPRPQPTPAPQPRAHPAATTPHQRTQQMPPARPPAQPPRHPPTQGGFDPPTIRRSDDLGDGATLRRPAGVDAPTKPRAQTSPAARAPRLTHLDPGQVDEVKKLIVKHLDLLKKRSNHYVLLGTHMDASPEEIRKAYFGLARQLHPDRLSALGITDDNREAQRLFAQVNTAFGVLSDPKNRQDYTSVLRRGGEAAVAAEQIAAEQLTERILEAEEAFRRGEAALRRDQLPTAIAEFQRAIELNPDEADYVALCTWAQFCASPDKMAVASSTRTALDRAISKAPRAVAPRFYLGRVERMLGRDTDALRHFQEVLALQPHHSEAATEVRVIEQRLAGGGGRKR